MSRKRSFWTSEGSFGKLRSTFRENAGAEDCWVHNILGDYKKLIR